MSGLTAGNDCPLTSSQEDYLEAIYTILREKEAVRAKDIATRLKVRSSSVTGALRALAQKSLVNYAPYGVITLTERGRCAAEDVARRHRLLRHFLEDILALPTDEAIRTACKMEHAVSRQTLTRLVAFMEFIGQCPLHGPRWDPQAGFACPQDGGQERCRCMLAAKGTPTAELTLADLAAGDRARVCDPHGRLADMGVKPNAEIAVQRVAADGERFEVLVRGYHLSLNGGEARQLRVTKLENEA